MSLELLGSPVLEHFVDIAASYTQPVGKVVHHGVARSLAVSVHLDSHRDPVPIGGCHLDAKQHAMCDLPGSYACQAADSGAEPLA